MSVPVIIEGCSGRQACVTDELELMVSQAPFPPLSRQKSRVFRHYLTSDGTSSGSDDMGVNGSSTNQSFYVKASENDDRYITNLSFIVAYGTSAQPYLFADAAALTNGVRIYYNSISGEVDIHDGVKSNQDLLRLGLDGVATSWEVRGVGGLNDYGYFVSVDLTRIMPPYGIKLDRGTSERLTVTIRDDASNADTFNCIAYGFDRFE